MNKSIASMLTCMILLSSFAHAGDYAVEIIVFEQLNNQADESGTYLEQWDFSWKLTAERIRRIKTLSQKATAYKTLDQLFHLETIRTDLINSNYRILETVSWQQPGYFYQNAPIVKFGSTDTELITGLARFYKTALIHVDVDLKFSPTTIQSPNYVTSFNGSNNVGTEQPHYFISENRRLKFNNIHYFDHPYFGVILGVWQVKSPISTGILQDSLLEKPLEFSFPINRL